MLAFKIPHWLAEADYLEGEKSSDIRHEYLEGAVYAMVGASDAHETIALNLAILLRLHLKGKPCKTFLSGMKVKIEKVNAYYYPDIMVTCDPEDRALDYYKGAPKLIVEVLSPTTQVFDRGKKFEHYRMLKSLKEYVLIDQDRQNIEVFRVNDNQQWVLYPYTSNQQEVYLSSVDLTCLHEDIYEDVLFPQVSE